MYSVGTRADQTRIVLRPDSISKLRKIHKEMNAVSTAGNAHTYIHGTCYLLTANKLQANLTSWSFACGWNPTFKTSSKGTFQMYKNINVIGKRRFSEGRRRQSSQKLQPRFQTLEKRAWLGCEILHLSRKPSGIILIIRAAYFFLIFKQTTDLRLLFSDFVCPSVHTTTCLSCLQSSCNPNLFRGDNLCMSCESISRIIRSMDLSLKI